MTPGTSWRWRTVYFSALVVAALALALGVAAATSDLTGSGAGQATTGTVALSVDGPATHVCDYGRVVPGDLTGSADCAFSVRYDGSITAYLSLSLLVASAAGPGGQPLYDGSNSDGLTLHVSDGHRSFTVPTGPGTTGGACPAGSTCWTAASELAGWYAGTSPDLTFSSGDAVTFTVIPHFPVTAAAAYQGGTATVTLTVQAVQAPANPLPGGCTTATIGQPCPASGSFTWS